MDILEETITSDEQELLTPAEYFGAIKERKNHITDEELNCVYDNCLELLNKYKITGQLCIEMTLSIILTMLQMTLLRLLILKVMKEKFRMRL